MEREERKDSIDEMIISGIIILIKNHIEMNEEEDSPIPMRPYIARLGAREDRRRFRRPAASVLAGLMRAFGRRGIRPDPATISQIGIFIRNIMEIARNEGDQIEISSSDDVLFLYKNSLIE